MDSFLERYRHAQVEVLYRNGSSPGYTDRGSLADASATWIELVKESKGRSETFLIPIAAIRILKVIGPPDSPAVTLLRPAEHPAEHPSDRDVETRA
jgi:hypothetical protein